MSKVLALVALAGLAAAAGLRGDDAQPTPKKRLLVITQSKGFVHDVVRRPKDGSHCLVEKALTEMGKKTGDFEAVCSQDARKAITAENLKNFDAVFFYTTGELDLSDTQKADLIGFIRKGKGFAGSHCATDTFYKWKAYGEMIGGYFDGHPWHEKIRVIVEDNAHPATKHFGKTFEITDEIYQFKTPYDRKNLRVLMRMDMSKERRVAKLNGRDLKATDKLELSFEGTKPTAKLNGKDVAVRSLNFSEPRGNRKDRDHALAWVKEYGKGKVFYTALGHRPEVWKDERFLKHMRGGLRYVMGMEEGDATPRPLK